jgi:glycine cleavage system aminomethyltransferase T
VVGIVMSAAYAHTIGAAAGLAVVEGSLLSDNPPTVEIDVAGSLVKATLSAQALYDPDGSRMRS